MELLQFNSYLDVKEYTPKLTAIWENMMEKKEEIDEMLSNIQSQIIDFENLGISYFIDPSNIKNDELKSYVIDTYRVFLDKVNNYLSIIDLDSITTLPDETVKVFKLVYSIFFSDGYDELYTLLLSSNIEKHYMVNDFKYIKDVFIMYFENIIASLQKLRSLMKDEKAIKAINDSINKYYVVKQYIEATDEKTISDFAMNLIGKMY